MCNPGWSDAGGAFALRYHGMGKKKKKYVNGKDVTSITDATPKTLFLCEANAAAMSM